MLKDMPADILTTAAAAVEAMPQRAPFKADVLEAIANAIQAERNRCESIIAAAREWDGDIQDAHERITSGSKARQIPGWNAPYENEAE